MKGKIKTSSTRRKITYKSDYRMTTLPKFVALKSKANNKYLRYVHEDSVNHGFLQFSGEEVVSPYTKFEVEKAKKSGEKELVNIRCCYNNKYWAIKLLEDYWIVPKADEPDENQSILSCTLFEVAAYDGATVKFRHANLSYYLCLKRKNELPQDCCLSTGPEKPYDDVFTIINWETLFILPKHIAFKDNNGHYLKAVLMKDKHVYLQFDESYVDIGDPKVWNEVVITPDGSVSIKSDHFGKFWRRSSIKNWIILADNSADDSTTSNFDPYDKLFWSTKVDDSAVALQNLANKQFCKPVTAEDKTNCLNAADPIISIYAPLNVEELVISRSITISDVKFWLKDARIYNQSVLTLCIKEAYNRTKNPKTTNLKLSYTETSGRCWKNNVSPKLVVKTTIRTGVPVIANETKIEIPSTGFTGEYQWGETKKLTTAVEKLYKVDVPAMTMVRVSLQATEATCDIPFSYSQYDTLIKGNQVTYEMDDGVYTGTNIFDIRYEKIEFKL